jgi:hypothetical protein
MESTASAIGFFDLGGLVCASARLRSRADNWIAGEAAHAKGGLRND